MTREDKLAKLNRYSALLSKIEKVEDLVAELGVAIRDAGYALTEDHMEAARVQTAEFLKRMSNQVVIDHYRLDSGR